MKRSTVVSFVVLLAWAVGSQAASPPSLENRSLFLYVILDGGANSTKQWNVLKALLLQSVHALQEGDQLEILAARPGSPSRKMTTVLGEPGSAERNRVIDVVSGVSKDLLFDANLGKALRVAVENLRRNGDRHRCCLLVLTDGNITNNQVAEIRKYASTCRLRDWPVCITAARREASRELLLASNQGEFDLRFIDRPSLGQWLESIRTPKLPAASPAYVEATDDTLVDTRPGRPKEPMAVKIVEMPPFASSRDTLESLHEDQTSVSPIPPTNKSGQGRDRSKGSLDWESLRPVAFAGGGLLATGVCIWFLYAVRRGVRAARSRRMRPEDGPEMGPMAIHLTALVDEDRLDLGELGTIREFTIGRGPGCAVYLDHEGVEDRHLEIRHRRKGLKIKNLATSPVVVNGKELSPRARMPLDLPVDIEVIPGINVTLLTEATESDLEVTHEDEVL